MSGPHGPERGLSARRQEHFYLEPNCSLVVPGEGDEVTIISSTQARRPARAVSSQGIVIGRDWVAALCAQGSACSQAALRHAGTVGDVAAVQPERLSPPERAAAARTHTPGSGCSAASRRASAACVCAAACSGMGSCTRAAADWG